MKRIMSSRIILMSCFILILLLFGNQTSNAQTFCTDTLNKSYSGIKDGYRYEIWNQNGQGDGCMTIGKGALFSGSWDGILNYLARRGLEYDTTMTHQEIGTFTANFVCDYKPTTETGNSYLSVYGWTTDPLVEFYIIEDWRKWIPSMAAGAVRKGTIEVDGSIYDIIKTTRLKQPSIDGTKTFPQYFSIRREVRDSGTVSISEHFKKWESFGLDLGNLYEVSFVVEGYQSRGEFEFKELEILVDEKNKK